MTLTRQGHPLIWSEWKPVSLWMHWYRDFAVDEVFDCCLGSGAAAIGAMHLNLPYYALAFNATHAAWNRRALQQVFYALVADGKTTVTEPFVANVQQLSSRGRSSAPVDAL